MKGALIPRKGGELWDPISMMRNLREEMDHVFERSFLTPRWAETHRLFVPEVDVKDEKDAVIVRADLPGMKKEDLEIDSQDDLLTLKGERKESQEKRGKDFYHAERFYGSFSRTIELPARVKTEGIKASYRDGVLEVRLPKADGAKPKHTRIPVE